MQKCSILAICPFNFLYSSDLLFLHIASISNGEYKFKKSKTSAYKRLYASKVACFLSCNTVILYVMIEQAIEANAIKAETSAIKSSTKFTPFNKIQSPTNHISYVLKLNPFFSI